MQDASLSRHRFRWVELQIDLFLSLDLDPLHHDTIHDMIDVLQRSASVSELNDTYDKIYERNTHERNYRRLAVKTFQWVLSCARPLYIGELITAVALKKNFELDSSVTESLLLSRICSNFITTNGAGRVQFTHLSVREYLEQKSGDFSLLTAHTLAAECCLASIQQPGFDFGEALPMKAGFPSYAVRYWSFHLKRASWRGEINESLKNLSHNFLCKGQSVLNWAEAFEHQYSIAKNVEPVQNMLEEKTKEVELLRNRLRERDEIIRYNEGKLAQKDQSLRAKSRFVDYLVAFLRNLGYSVVDGIAR